MCVARVYCESVWSESIVRVCGAESIVSVCGAESIVSVCGAESFSAEFVFRRI